MNIYLPQNVYVGNYVEKPCYDGTQKLYRFPNGRGASVVRHFGSLGREVMGWELAVIQWIGDDFVLDYSTEITSDVLGWLTDTEVHEIVARIAEMPPGAAHELQASLRSNDRNMKVNLLCCVKKLVQR